MPGALILFFNKEIRRGGYFVFGKGAKGGNLFPVMQKVKKYFLGGANRG